MLFFDHVKTMDKNYRFDNVIFLDNVVVIFLPFYNLCRVFLSYQLHGIVMSTGIVFDSSITLKVIRTGIGESGDGHFLIKININDRILIAMAICWQNTYASSFTPQF